MLGHVKSRHHSSRGLALVKIQALLNHTLWCFSLLVYVVIQDVMVPFFASEKFSRGDDDDDDVVVIFLFSRGTE